MEGPRVGLLIILLLFIFFSPEPRTLRYHDPNQDDRLAIEKQEDFNALANSTYGDLPSKGLNLTGLRIEDGYQLQLLPVAQKLSERQQVNDWYGFPRLTPIYHNVDSEVRGDFELIDTHKDRSRPLNLTELDPLTEYISETFERNVTDPKGQLRLRLEGIGLSSPYLSQDIKASLSVFTENSSGNGWDARLRGLRFPSGSIILTTASRKFNSLPALPHFTLSEAEFVRATTAMTTSLNEIWDMIDQQGGGDVDIFAPRCELIVWLHQKPLEGDSLYIAEIESELRNPDGAPIDQPPPIAFSATIFSPDCGYILKADTLYGPKDEVFSGLMRRMTAAFCIILIGQIVLLKRQMEKCATPSTRSRVSYQTFVIAAFSDGLTFFALVGLLVVDVSVFLIAGVAAFLCCVHVAFLEVKFIFDIWTVQVGDPANAQLERQRRAAASATPGNADVPVNTTTTSDSATPAPITAESIAAPPTAAPPNPIPASDLSGAGLPLPATAQRTSPTSPPPFIISSDQDTILPTTTTTAQPPTARTTFISLYSRFYFTLINLMFLTLWSTSWSPRLRHIYLNTLALLFTSLWIPQIHRNTMRNCRKALTWEYVLGSSTLRSVPILHWYLMPRNILYASPNPTMALVLIVWLSLQVLILAIQQFLGPRIFVPEKWCPEAYDYHPILYDDLEAGGMPIGEITSASEAKDADRKDKDTAGMRKVFDCAICMNEIDVPVVSKEERESSGIGGGRWLEQRNYMVTPCRHIFHSECLDGWMNMRLVCPVCREGLPPL